MGFLTNCGQNAQIKDEANCFTKSEITFFSYIENLDHCGAVQPRHPTSLVVLRHIKEKGN